MKIYCISDEIETALGLKLSGVESSILKEKTEIDKKIDEISENKEIGILVVTDKIYNLSSEKLDYIKEFKKTPLIVKI